MMCKFYIPTLLCMVVVLLATHSDLPAQNNIYNVTDYGARADGITNDREAIDKAIEACHRNGGGTVFFPKGVYVSATIHLKSNVLLKFEKKTVLLGAKEPIYDKPEPNPWDKYQDFGHSHYRPALFYGRNLENIGIEGQVLIDGRGFTTSNDVIPGNANRGISLVACKNITLKDFTITQCGHFGIIVNDCHGIEVENIHIDQYESRDGFNIVGSTGVKVSHSTIRGSDDAIVLKSDYSLGKDLNVENIVIRNCEITSKTCNSFQIGSETVGDFKNILVEDCKITGSGKAGLGITSNDGGNIENLTFKNIEIKQSAIPFFIYTSSRLRAPGKRTTGKISNITFSDIQVKKALNQYARSERKSWTSTINGVAEGSIENVTFERVSIKYMGGGLAEDREVNVPDNTSSASPRHLKIRPAYGWYIRRAKDIKFINCKLLSRKKDNRPAFFIDKSQNIVFNQVSYPVFQDTPAIMIKDSSGINCLAMKGCNGSYGEITGTREFYLD